jgi:osmotically-inducible protein OsmY
MHSEMGHRGHGPKNYTRPDERIREDVCEMLTSHDGIDARDIEVIVERGEVTLAGSVTSHTMKVLALEAVAAIHGVTRVNDRLRESGEVDASQTATK